MAPRSRKTLPCTYSQRRENKALDAEPPVASFLKSMLIGGGPVNAIVRLPIRRTCDATQHSSDPLRASLRALRVLRGSRFSSRRP